MEHLAGQGPGRGIAPELAAAHIKAVEAVTAAYHAEVGTAPPAH